nr:MAG TPA: hypothetical protein [Caudoviricetes sp.]
MFEVPIRLNSWLNSSSLRDSLYFVELAQYSVCLSSQC